MATRQCGKCRKRVPVGTSGRIPNHTANTLAGAVLCVPNRREPRGKRNRGGSVYAIPMGFTQ